MRYLLSSVALAIAWTAGAQGTSEGIAGHFNSSPAVTFINGTAGWTFQPTDFIRVTDLGCFNDVFRKNSSLAAIQVGLWTSAGSLLSSNLVTRPGDLTSENSFVPVSGVDLTAGEVYHIGAYSSLIDLSVEVCGGGAGGSVTMGTNLLLRAAAQNTDPSGLRFPAELGAAGNAAYLYPNFRYEGRIPEPASGLLLGLAALILAARGTIRPR